MTLYEGPDWDRELETARDELEREVKKLRETGESDGLDDLREKVAGDDVSLAAYVDEKQRLRGLRETS